MGFNSAFKGLIWYGPRGETVGPSPAVLISDNLNWGCTGSLDMLEYEVMRSPTSSQGAALF